jgi:hypothetical protein
MLNISLLICLLTWACGNQRTAAPLAPTPGAASTTETPAPAAQAPAPGPVASPSSNVKLTDDLGGRALFPPDNWWNQDVSSAPVDPQSNAYINFIGRTRTLHPDFGPPPYGIPYVGVGGAEPRVPVTFVAYGDESDAGFRDEAGYPIPVAAQSQPNYIEGGVPGGASGGDRHLLIVDRDKWMLYELYAAQWNAQRGRWEAESGAIFDLSANGRRPDGWTSADAAGLAILPGLVRYDEASRGPITHALRATVRATNHYVWPASHRAGNTPGALPMGARLRFKASKDLSPYPSYIRNIFRAMQTHGLIIADNGSDMFVTGATDPRWNNDELNTAFRGLSANDFEVIQLGWR